MEQQEVVQELQRSGLLQFACNAGYLDNLTRDPTFNAGLFGGGQSSNEDAAPVMVSAAASTATAEAELARSQKRLQSILQHSSDAGAAFPSTESMGKQGRKCAHTSGDQSAGRGANKGLRHFAMQVCNKIEAKGRTTYNEVADELAIELKDQPDAGGDDKNIRRRVYDAFNVLLAVGVISKEGKKEIIWKGFPGNQTADISMAHAERTKRIQDIQKKQKELQDMIEQQTMVKQLLEVNPVRTPMDTDMALQIPFVLVAAKPEATVEVSVSENMQDVDFKFNAPFAVHDDIYVLQQIIQHYGSIRSMLQPSGECAASS